MHIYICIYMYVPLAIEVCTVATDTQERGQQRPQQPPPPPSPVPAQQQ